ncbi:VTT domain-containing protein, partial [Candidatus Dependentiae bacterium]|nr:VTT domain-containing protein [Candidatus Dependentiae bacterium]
MTSAELPVLLLTYFETYQHLIIPGLIFFITIVPVPVPEDILLISFGFLAAKNNQNLTIIILLSFFSVILSDLFLYYFGVALEKFALAKSENFFLSKKIKKGMFYFNSFGSPIIFIARFVFGMRSAVFITSGLLNFKLKKFIILNSLAGIIQIPLLISLGLIYSNKIDLIIYYIIRNKNYLTFISLFIIISIFIFQFLKFYFF